MNAVTPAYGDSIPLFDDDTRKSGGGLSDGNLVQALIEDSPAALQFLESFGAALPHVVQLGGHSVPRTHTPATGASVGVAIMKTLLDHIAHEPSIRLQTGCRLSGLDLDPTQARIQGVRVHLTSSEGSQAPETVLGADAVVLATGGFGANREMLARYCGPGIASLATSCGAFAQGEALGMAEGAGARLSQMDRVQVHPTGGTSIRMKG